MLKGPAPWIRAGHSSSVGMRIPPGAAESESHSMLFAVYPDVYPGVGVGDGKSDLLLLYWTCVWSTCEKKRGRGGSTPRCNEHAKNQKQEFHRWFYVNVCASPCAPPSVKSRLRPTRPRVTPGVSISGPLSLVNHSKVSSATPRRCRERFGF